MDNLELEQGGLVPGFYVYRGCQESGKEGVLSGWNPVSWQLATVWEAARCAQVGQAASHKLRRSEHDVAAVARG